MRMTKKFGTLIISTVMAITLISSSLAAEDNPTRSVSCVGTIDEFYVADFGGLYVDGSWETSSVNYINICNVKKDIWGVTPEICRSWQAILTSAMLAGKKVRIRWDFPVGGNESCSNLPDWSEASMAPEYVRIYK